MGAHRCSTSLRLLCLQASIDWSMLRAFCLCHSHFSKRMAGSASYHVTPLLLRCSIYHLKRYVSSSLWALACRSPISCDASRNLTAHLRASAANSWGAWGDRFGWTGQYLSGHMPPLECSLIVVWCCPAVHQPGYQPGHAGPPGASSQLGAQSRAQRPRGRRAAGLCPYSPGCVARCICDRHTCYRQVSI